MMIPKISVIVPVYNVEKYLPRCIDSILSQSFTDFELLLIDDGSPDNSGIICDEYAQKDSRVRVFHKPNGGVSSARNLGIDNAIGEWITFIDSDDYIEQDFFWMPRNVTEDLLILNYTNLNDGIYIPFKLEIDNIVLTKIEMQYFINKNLPLGIFMSPWSKFYKRKLIVDNNISFHSEVKVGEDCIFVLDYLMVAKSLRFLTSSNYVYVGGFEPSKYRQSVERSLMAFELTIERYDKLNADCIKFLLLRFVLYYDLISPRNYKTLKLWRENEVVKRIYKEISHELGWQWNLLYNFYIFNELYLFYKRFVGWFHKSFKVCLL